MAAFQAVIVAALTAAAAPAATPAAPTLAAPVPDIDQVCAATACRAGGFEAVVGVDEEHFTTIPISHSPYITENGTLLIFPGETVAFRFSADKDKLLPVSAQRLAPDFPALIVIGNGAPKDDPQNAMLPAVNLGALPPNTLIVSYGQLKTRGEHGLTMSLRHNLAHVLKLDAVVNQVKPHAYDRHGTSTCPVPPKLVGYENWPDTLGPILLTNFRFLPDGGDMTCN